MTISPSNSNNRPIAPDTIEIHLKEDDLMEIWNDFKQVVKDSSWGGDHRTHYLDRMLAALEKSAEELPNHLGPSTAEKMSKYIGKLLLNKELTEEHLYKIKTSDGKTVETPKLYIHTNSTLREMFETALEGDEEFDFPLSSKAYSYLSTLGREMPSTPELFQELINFTEMFGLDQLKDLYVKGYITSLQGMEAFKEACSFLGETCYEMDLSIFHEFLPGSVSLVPYGGAIILEGRARKTPFISINLNTFAQGGVEENMERLHDILETLKAHFPQEIAPYCQTIRLHSGSISNELMKALVTEFSDTATMLQFDDSNVEGFEHLVEFPHLTRLYIHKTPITDQVVNEVIINISTLYALEFKFCPEMTVASKDAIEEHKGSTLPDLQYFNFE